MDDKLIEGGIVALQPESSGIKTNRHVHQRRTAYDWCIDVLLMVLVAVIIVAVVYPLWFVVIASFSDQTLVATGKVTLFPSGFTLSGYDKIFSNVRVWSGYKNTLIYSVVGTVLNLVVTMPAAFALSRREFPMRRMVMFLFTFTMYFAGGLIPNYVLFKQLHLLNNMWVFILPGAVSVWNLIIARSFFETSIPEDLHDAAQLDGLNDFSYFLRVVIPLSSAIVAVIGLYYFVGHWNDYFTGLIYIRDDAKQPLQNILQSILLGSQTQTTGQVTAGVDIQQLQQLADQIKYGVIIISTIPLLVLYPFLQKYFNKGVLIGAVKG
ncbi:carbohydrate ABC transporter permease [Bifidobacterium aquikefiri]|uniref:carbohydrate ABC transporter permease n=1 Tax=Bifidobacterium aquikefiri TaxID=1653207 RepID=UPI0039E99345